MRFNICCDLGVFDIIASHTPNFHSTLTNTWHRHKKHARITHNPPMSAKACREFHGKKLISRFLNEEGFDVDDRAALIKPDTDITLLEDSEPWLSTARLVVKPDQLIKRRGKAGLVGVDLDLPSVKSWVSARMNKPIKVEAVTGTLDTFIVEPFVEHGQDDEYYVCIQSVREGEEVLFYHEGGVDVGDVDSKVREREIDERRLFAGNRS